MPVVIFLGILIVILVVQALIYQKLALKHLETDVYFSTSIASKGDIIVITESIANKKMLPLPWVTLKFEASRGLDFLDMTNTARSDHYYREDLLSLGVWQRHDRHIRVLCSRRGYFRFVRLVVSTRDLLLLSRITGNFPCESSLIVTPDRIRAPEIDQLFQRFLGETVNPRSQVPDPFTFAGIREYSPRDPFRDINWKASAKNEQLMVNVRNRTNRRELTILLNVMPYTLSKDYFLLEKCISLAMTWFSNAAEQDIPVRLLSNSKDILTQEEIDTQLGSGEEHVRNLGISLAKIDLSQRVDFFLPTAERALETGGIENTYVILSANADHRLQAYVKDRRHDGYAIYWVLLHEQTPPELDAEVLSYTTFMEVGNDR